MQQQQLSEQPTSLIQTSDNKKIGRILLVDDDVCFLRIAAQILADEYGFEVQTAESVDIALQKIEKQPFDAIVSDYNMPQKTGL